MPRPVTSRDFVGVAHSALPVAGSMASIRAETAPGGGVCAAQRVVEPALVALHVTAEPVATTGVQGVPAGVVDPCRRVGAETPVSNRAAASHTDVPMSALVRGT